MHSLYVPVLICADFYKHSFDLCRFWSVRDLIYAVWKVLGWNCSHLISTCFDLCMFWIVRFWSVRVSMRGLWIVKFDLYGFDMCELGSSCVWIRLVIDSCFFNLLRVLSVGVSTSTNFDVGGFWIMLFWSVQFDERVFWIAPFWSVWLLICVAFDLCVVRIVWLGFVMVLMFWSAWRDVKLSADDFFINLSISTPIPFAYNPTQTPKQIEI